MAEIQKVALFTNEYPPNVYGGAGVHVEYLSRELARHTRVEVRCFGNQDSADGNLTVKGYPAWPGAKENTDPRFAGAMDAFGRSLAMAKDNLDAQVVHCHTWYTDMAGFIAKKLWDTPLVLTIHSLEPRRPWKVEQLGNAYYLSTWMEHTSIEDADAIIAVSKEVKEDVLRFFNVSPHRVHVIHNGIDLEEFRYDPSTDALVERGIDPNRPYVLFVGRITRQKGIMHLVRAIPEIDPSLQVVLCANSPDTEEIGQEMTEWAGEVRAKREGVFWFLEKVPLPDLIQFYSHAAVFCCPSVYEPFGLINLEAMACETAVVASNVGGIPEVVVPEETGLLVDPRLEEDDFEPVSPARYSRELAAAINRIGLDPALQERMGKAGRQRAEEHFSWSAIARKTLSLYGSLVSS
ncbi:MAG TPA: glycogen synthase [Chloroflexota bacterium]|nr:glycogen synthase [Chloroflexota bacterium]